MEKTTNKSKQRLYKVATELNLSHDLLIEFLTKKGFKVKGHMSAIDEEMMAEILKHFKKEKVDADRHARKRKEYDEKEQRRRGDLKKEERKVEPKDKKAEEDAAEKKKEETVVAEAEKSVAVKRTKKDVESEAKPERVASIEPEKKTEKKKPQLRKAAKEKVETEPEARQLVPDRGEDLLESIDGIGEQEAAETVVAAVEETEDAASEEALSAEDAIDVEPEEVVADVREEEDQQGKTEEDVLSIESSMPKMGLTVKGRIDLDEVKRKSARKVTVDKAAKKAKTSEKKPKKVEADRSSTSELQASAEPLKRKKRKKKIVRDAEVVPGEEGKAEEGRRKKISRSKQPEVDMDEVNDAIRRTLAQMDDSGPQAGRAVARRKKREKKQEQELKLQEIAEKEKRILRITEFMTLNELANMMRVTAAEVISKLMGMGVMASINQRLDFELMTLVAADFGFDVEKHDALSFDAIEDFDDPAEALAERPPIVTIMGHVDHGKTSLLDYIRETNVVAGESGGITQHIGAYTVSLKDGRRITFLDTPGHEAFTAMRARGAQLTDIVVLVVAADDSVMPQTVEAISHALAANVPIIIAINKIDKPEANAERIRQQLADKNILVEDWGGKYGCVEISAKKGTNVGELLNRILLEADVLDLKANPDRRARGVVVEAKLDRGTGVVVTVLIQKGTLEIGDPFVVGSVSGKVRALLDERNNRVPEALPSMPVQVTGFDSMPSAGDFFVVLESDREAREIGMRRQQIRREMTFRAMQRKTLDDISAQIKLGGVKELSLLVKGDVDGSVEALADSLMKLSTPEVGVNVIHRGIGAISESDVLLASASDAIIIGFHVRPHLNARKLAATEQVDIRLYDIIYDAVRDVRDALEGLLSPELKEEVTATVEVRETFKISRIGTIAGCYVQDGRITRNNKVRLVRDGIVIFSGAIGTLKRFKDDVREVEQGYECGIALEGYNDIKVGDVIEAFRTVETKRVLV